MIENQGEPKQRLLSRRQFLELGTAAFLLTACGEQPTATAVPTATTKATPTFIPVDTTTDTRTATETSTPNPDKEKNLFSFLEQYGVNLAGAEFGKIPGKMGQDYVYPDDDSFKKWASNGIQLIRYPVRIERLMVNGQPTEDIQYVGAALDSAKKNNQKLIIDAHNYGRIWDKGTERLIQPQEMAPFWGMMATKFRGHEGLAAHGLMNEPHDMNGTWSKLAQASIDAIRAADKKTPILVAGENWSGAHSWKDVNANLADTIYDPQNLMGFEAHEYFDPQFGGSYDCGSASQCQAKPELVNERLSPFLNWLQEHNVHGFIGEMGFPVADEGWKPVYDQAMNLLKRNKVGATLWAAGPRWGDYKLSLEKPEATWLVQELGKK